MEPSPPVQYSQQQRLLNVDQLMTSNETHMATPSSDANGPSALVVGTASGVATTHSLAVGRQLTFGRDRTVDVRFPADGRLSRLAGTIRGLSEGVAIANLSATHDIYIKSDTGPIRLAATVAGKPIASILLAGGSARITWPGSMSFITVDIADRQLSPSVVSVAIATGRSTVHPLTLNPRTKEFAVALLLCQPRLDAVPGATATPSIPELTRQILVSMSSFQLLADFDNDKATRGRLTARTYEHLKNLRDKLVRAKLSNEGGGLSPEAIVDLLICHNVLSAKHLDLLNDSEWLTWQEQEWER